VSFDEAKEPVEGAGYAVANIGNLGEGYGFRKIRKDVGVTEFGVNAIVLPAGAETGFHLHERQQELYLVIDGELEIEFDDGKGFKLSAGGVARVDAPVARKIRNSGKGDATYVIVGAEGGYVGRDGKLPEGEQRMATPGATGD
jgi:mannose-6-phosphate isomerase-like protein (cupin superfamily)